MLKWNNGRGEWSRMAEWQSFLCFSKKLAFHSCAAMAHDRKIQIRTKKRPTFWTDFLEQQTRMKNPEWEWEWLDSTAIEHAAAPNITEAVVSGRCRIFNDILYEVLNWRRSFSIFYCLSNRIENRQKRKIKLPQDVWYNCTYRSIYIWYA